MFTDWDPTAKNDLQALLDVFDTNHNGMLDAGDAQFSSFKILVTNADGTTTLETLAQAGVQSINLIPDATTIVLPDGSVIQGQSTFNKVSGGTARRGARHRPPRSCSRRRPANPCPPRIKAALPLSVPTDNLTLMSSVC